LHSASFTQNESFSFDVYKKTKDKISLTLREYSEAEEGGELLGQKSVPVVLLEDNEEKKEWIRLKGEKGVDPELLVSFSLKRIREDSDTDSNEEDSEEE